MSSSSSPRRQLESPPHGFGDDTRGRVLRRRPAPEVIAWVEAALGVTVRRWRARRGGSSSAIHELWVESPGRSMSAVILRRYVIEAISEEEPDIVAREATALRVLEHVDLPTPEVLAVDEDGSATGMLTLAMSRLPGRVDWFPADIDSWLFGLARSLSPLHDAPPTADNGVPNFQPYEPESWAPPPWLTRPSLWERAVEVFHEPPVDEERVLIHRDYHPGNVLWRRGRVTGVVDWQAMSIGPTTVDAVWCKHNLLGRFGIDIADRFVAIWQAVSGRTYHPWSEVVLLIDIMGSGHLSSRHQRDEVERTLARSLAALGR